MEKCKLNGHSISSKKDLEHYIASVEKEWGRPMSSIGINFLYSRLQSCFNESGVKIESESTKTRHVENVSMQSELSFTFAERLSGKSPFQLRQQRKTRLEEAHARREKEAREFGYW